MIRFRLLQESATGTEWQNHQYCSGFYLALHFILVHKFSQYRLHQLSRGLCISFATFPWFFRTKFPSLSPECLVHIYYIHSGILPPPPLPAQGDAFLPVDERLIMPRPLRLFHTTAACCSWKRPPLFCCSSSKGQRLLKEEEPSASLSFSLQNHLVQAGRITKTISSVI